MGVINDDFLVDSLLAGSAYRQHHRVKWILTFWWISDGRKCVSTLQETESRH